MSGCVRVGSIECPETLSINMAQPSRGDGSINEMVGDRLRDREETIATAESLTGGLISSTLTDVPGSSDYFERGFVTYAYDAKRQALSVAREALDEHGAVSPPVAEQMAQGARDIADTTWGVSATGIAGPGGGTADKPVGLVYIGVAYAGPWGTETSFSTSTRHVFDGDRRSIKQQTVTACLEALAEAIDTVEVDE